MLGTYSERRSNRCGAGKWIRTTDLLITNQLLYQLSYSGAGAKNNRFVGAFEGRASIGTLDLLRELAAHRRSGAYLSRSLCSCAGQHDRVDGAVVLLRLPTEHQQVRVRRTVEHARLVRAVAQPEVLFEHLDRGDVVRPARRCATSGCSRCRAEARPQTEPRSCQPRPSIRSA